MKHIKLFENFISFNEATENPNISDVRNSLKKNDIVKYDGDRYIILDIIDDELLIRSLRNPYGGSYHTSPMSYSNLKVKIDNPKLEFFS